MKKFLPILLLGLLSTACMAEQPIDIPSDNTIQAYEPSEQALLIDNHWVDNGLLYGSENGEIFFGEAVNFRGRSNNSYTSVDVVVTRATDDRSFMGRFHVMESLNDGMRPDTSYNSEDDSNVIGLFCAGPAPFQWDVDRPSQTTAGFVEELPNGGRLVTFTLQLDEGLQPVVGQFEIHPNNT